MSHVISTMAKNVSMQVGWWHSQVLGPILSAALLAWHTPRDCWLPTFCDNLLSQDQHPFGAPVGVLASWCSEWWRPRSTQIYPEVCIPAEDNQAAIKFLQTQQQKTKVLFDRYAQWRLLLPGGQVLLLLSTDLKKHLLNGKGHAQQWNGLMLTTTLCRWVSMSIVTTSANWNTTRVALGTPKYSTGTPRRIYTVQQCSITRQ